MTRTTVDAHQIAANVERLRARVADVAETHGRSPADITVIAVSKTHPREAIDAAWSAGVRDFGESRVQELREKIREPMPDGSRLHLIGQLQTNKVRDALRLVDVVHAVDRERLVDVLAREAERIALRLDVLLQVNIAREAQKGGCTPDDAGEILALIKAHSSLNAAGLMTIAPNVDDPEDTRPTFRALRLLRDRLATPDVPLTMLSMGMSNDFPAAIAEGATHIRVGSAIFGSRG